MHVIIVSFPFIILIKSSRVNCDVLLTEAIVLPLKKKAECGIKDFAFISKL
jgi:hypothetical protein